MLAVVLEGGAVQAVISDDPKCPLREVTIIDYDTDGLNAEDLRTRAQMVPQDDGKDVPAIVDTFEVGKPGIDLGGMREPNDADLKALGFMGENA